MFTGLMANTWIAASVVAAPGQSTVTFTVSTTKVSPSHQPVESPSQSARAAGPWAAWAAALVGNTGTPRASWIISTSMAT